MTDCIPYSISLRNLDGSFELLELLNIQLVESVERWWGITSLKEEILEDIAATNQHISNLLDKQLDEYMQLDEYYEVPKPFWNKALACQMLKIRVALLEHDAQKKYISQLLDEQLEDYFASVPPPPNAYSTYSRGPLSPWNKKSACMLLRSRICEYQLGDKFPVGTKVRWYLDQDNCSLCVQRPYGFLEVCSIRNGKVISAKLTKSLRGIQGADLTIFKSYSEWKSTLPPNGSITVDRP
jgi:hypothetical protein